MAGPYSGPNDPGLPQAIKDKDSYQRRAWVRNYNAFLDTALGKGMSAEDADPLAVTVADYLCEGDAYYYGEYSPAQLAEHEALIAAEDDGPTKAFLKKLREELSGKVDADTLSQAIKTARSHAGGKAKAEQAATKKAEDEAKAATATTVTVTSTTNAPGDAPRVAQLPPNVVPIDRKAMMRTAEQGANLYGRWDTALTVAFGEVAADEPIPTRIPMLPIPHTYTHPLWGEIVITREGNELFVQNFKQRVYQDKLPLDAEHQTKLSGAYAWITDLEMNEDGSADAIVEWTARGEKLVREGGFCYISPEWYPQWTDPGTGQTYSNVLIGGAVCTRPFFKEDYLRKLVASERLLATEDGARLAHEGGQTMADKDKETVPVTAAELAALTAQMSEQATKMTELVASFSEYKETVVPKLIADAAEAAKAETAQEFGEKLSAAETERAELAKKLEASEQVAQTASEHVKTMLANARTRRFTDEARGKSGANPYPWHGEVEKNVARMEKLAEAFGEDSDEFRDYLEQQRTQARVMAEATLKEKGSSYTPPIGFTNAEQAIETAVRAYMSEHPGTSFEEAYLAYLDTNPQAYTEYAEQHPGSRQFGE
jgi:hypothetical protein